MPWSQTQMQRLGVEKAILEEYFKGRVTWIDPRGNTKVQVQMTTSNNKNYTLMIPIASDFPNSCPTLLIASPKVLKLKDGRDLPHGSAWHNLGRVDGCVKICHYRDNLWNGDTTLYQVFMKGLIWLEAYEAHLKDGKPLDKYLKEC